MDIFRFELEETTDDGGQQLLKGLGLPGEQLVKVARVMPHGLASNAPVGSHGIGMAVNGRRDEVAVIGLETAGKRTRNVPVGGTALYDARGNVIKMFGEAVDMDFSSRPFNLKCGVFTIECAEVVMKSGSTVIRLRNGRIDLGAMVATNAVMTDGGPSTKVFAVT